MNTSSFLAMLTILFIALKLCGVIAWAWWIVLLPLWGPLVVTLLFIGACAGLAFLASKLPH